MSRRLLVTGAAGAVGGRLLPVLRVAGWRVRALEHRRLVPAADERVDGDLADAASLARALAGVDAVVHLAAITHARNPRAYELNRAGTSAIVAACRGAGVDRLVHVSTTAVDPAGGAYSASKSAAEDAVRASGLDWVIVRLPEVYGAGGNEGVDAILARARAGRRIPVVGDGSDVVCPVHIDDALTALVAALTAPPQREHTLAGECMTVAAFAQEVVSLLGSASRVTPVPISVVALASRLARVAPLPLYPDQLARLRSPKQRDASSARAELGFAPRSLPRGLVQH